MCLCNLVLEQPPGIFPVHEATRRRFAKFSANLRKNLQLVASAANVTSCCEHSIHGHFANIAIFNKKLSEDHFIRIPLRSYAKDVISKRFSVAIYLDDDDVVLFYSVFDSVGGHVDIIEGEYLTYRDANKDRSERLYFH